MTSYLYRLSLCRGRCVLVGQSCFKNDTVLSIGIVQRCQSTLPSTNHSQSSSATNHKTLSPPNKNKTRDFQLEKNLLQKINCNPSSAPEDGAKSSLAKGFMPLISDDVGVNSVKSSLNHTLHSQSESLNSSFLQNKSDPLIGGSTEPKLVETSLNFSDATSKDEPKKSNEEKNSELEKVAFNLTYDLTNIFIRSVDWSLYAKDIIFENRIRGKTVQGIGEYMKAIYKVRLVAHIKFVYVRFNVIKLTTHPEDMSIRVRWRIVGLGVFRIALRYFPDRMWRRGNMDKVAPTWYDGYSIFYVGKDNKIFKHIADRRMLDEDKEPSILNPVVEKLKKLRPAAPAAPVLGSTATATVTATSTPTNS